MRTKITLFLCSLIAVTSCNNDDSTQNRASGLTLYKTVKFSPTEEAYNLHAEGSTKNITYYENNLVVADTLYNYNGGVEASGIHEYTANTHFSTYKYLNPSGSSHTTEDTYDSNGRILEEKTTFYQNGTISSIDMKTITYTNNIVTLTLSNPQNNTILGSFEYLLNPDGLIYQFTGLGGYYMKIDYAPEGKPVSFSAFLGNSVPAWVKNVTYYDNIAMPTSQLKTSNQINNMLLKTRMENIFLECNYYCKSIDPGIIFEKTFNEFGNILYSKQAISNEQGYPAEEIFYYYNQ